MFSRSLLACLFLPVIAIAEPPKQVGPDPKQWGDTVDRATGYLKKSQSDDGSWGSSKNPGITGVALTGILDCGRLRPDDEVPARALKYIESLINPKAGHIAGADPKVQLQNYVTSVNVMALQAARSD